ncbi:Probable RNA-directed DNA polymerase from transposon BS [Eumeta japonica]|uniref:Probable RNA-directed DNA polymerase from transposon BS n=1 Tax=Eumeta variegata TaxID=151549 RepID=A0A4C1U5L9_EUMVA|nr:Probable RNA-directed DNA polymerase from transposon BS [Eumeta japonica]
MSNYERTGHTVVRGTALYYRRSLHCGSINIPPLTNMEATGCRLAMTGHSALVIVSVCLPSPKQLLRRDLRALFALGDAVILFGDFNCKNIRWGCPSNNYNGIKLDELEDRLDFGIIAPSTSTCFPHVVTHRPSTIDIALTKGVALNFNSALTNHVRTVVEESEREVPASSDRRKFPPDILELIRAKTQLCAARAYPTPEYRSRARALQREVKARVREFRNEMAIDDAEIAECLADSIETQCSHASPPHDIAHISRIEEEVLQKTSLEPKDDLAPVSLSEVQTLVKSLNTRKAPGLDGISNKAIKCFSIPLLSLLVAIFNACIKNCYFPPAWKEAEQVLRLVEYVSEGFETERSTVAVFFDVAKAFDRQTDISHLGMSALTRQDVLSEQEFLKAPPSLLCCTPRTQTMYRDRRRLASNSRYSRTIPRSFTEIGIGAPDSPSSPQRAIDELGQWFRKWRIEVNPTNQQPYNSSMVRLESTHCRQNTPNLKMLDAIIPWQRNYKYLGVTLDKIYTSEIISSVLEILHFSTKQGSGPCSVEKVNYLDVINVPYTKCALGRDLELPTISKYMKDASKRFFDIAGSHPNALLRAAVDYQPPHPTLSVGHETYLPIHLTLLQRRLKA